MALKDWKKIKGIPIELDEGDNFHAIWEKDGLYLFVIDDNFGEFILGEKWKSQMDEPTIISRAKTELRNWNEKYNQYRELSKIVNAIATLLEED